jgi:hypothetical protein
VTASALRAENLGGYDPQGHAAGSADLAVTAIPGASDWLLA